MSAIGMTKRFEWLSRNRHLCTDFSRMARPIRSIRSRISVESRPTGNQDTSNVSTERHASSKQSKIQLMLLCNSLSHSKTPRIMAQKSSEEDMPSNYTLQLGERVVWCSDDGPEKGTVRWIGFLPEQSSRKIGVEFDNPVGTGSGKYKGLRLFHTKHGHASLIPVLGLMKLEDFEKPASPIHSSTEENRLLKKENCALMEQNHLLMEENRQERKQCIICMNAEVCVTFSPCGHFVCCSRCAPGLRLCPICREKIQSTVKTYMA